MIVIDTEIYQTRPSGRWKRNDHPHPDDRPSQWMDHRHILEHDAAGMMGHFEVVRP